MNNDKSTPFSLGKRAHINVINRMFVAFALSCMWVEGETLYNGIVLPSEWPPRIDAKNQAPLKAPYLEREHIPAVIPIDVGRQLFVDDFLIESTNGMVRAFPKPVKRFDNPVMWPGSKAEMAALAPGCAMSGGAVWWDPTRRRFRMWYMSGFAGRISYAESPDGLKWERPAVGPNGDNVILPQQVSDTFSVWPDYAAANPYANWRMCISPGGNPTRGVEYISKDGIAWTFAKRTGYEGDCSTIMYNPFRNKWIWSIRARWRRRSRAYHEHEDFIAGADWTTPKELQLSGKKPFTDEPEGAPPCVLWLACDSEDITCTLNGTVRKPTLYNVDAVPYESLMVGLFKIICGYDNDEASKAGMPKSTSIHFAYSRDGFHYTRPDRTPAISGSGWGSGAWDSGYVGNISSCFVIKDEQLWIYYVGARGDGTKNDPPICTYKNGMHWNFSVGVAMLRRDGFACMVSDGRGELVTRPVKFSGSHFFVNADARFGKLAVEVLGEDGRPFSGYSAADCRGLVREDSTRRELTWTGGDLSRFSGKPVRFRFVQQVASLYSFWVSKSPSGNSGGYLAAGGPDYKGLKDELVMEKRPSK